MKKTTAKSKEAKELEELVKWCCEQRIARDAGKLSADRIAKLDAIGFDWNACKTCMAREATHKMEVN